MKSFLSRSLISFSILLSFGTAWAGQASVIPPKTEIKYPLVPMRAEYVAKDVKNGLVYMTPEQREEIRIVIRSGIVHTRTGEVILETKNNFGNLMNYVMDAAGNFYLFDEYTFHKVRHSSPFAGGPLAGAGDIIISGGRIIYIDAKSGHYPVKKVFQNTLKELAADGVDLTQIQTKQKLPLAM